jgi:hypothetical protein
VTGFRQSPPADRRRAEAATNDRSAWSSAVDPWQTDEVELVVDDREGVGEPAHDPSKFHEAGIGQGSTGPGCKGSTHGV